MPGILGFNPSISSTGLVRIKSKLLNASLKPDTPNVKGLDFAVEGLGEFENITHAEAKNAVGSAIEIADGFDANIWKQGKKIGKKSVWEKKFWSNTSRTSQVPNLNSDAYLPKSVNSMLTVVDCYDVPNFEKQTMNSAINFGAKIL